MTRGLSVAPALAGAALGALITALVGCGHRASEPAGPRFRDVAAETGINFHHFTGATGKFFLPEIMGSGVALLDYDNDGDLDIFFVQSTTLEPGAPLTFAPPAGFKPGNRLFRNMLKETGKLQFVDVTDQAGLSSIAYGMGVAVGDYNNDGYPDLYITNFGSNVLYRNNGDGTFTDVANEAGLADGGWSTSASWVDYDKDGNLDLYVAHYLDFTVRGNKDCFTPTGERDYCSPKAYKGVTDRLYRNLGNGKFEDVTVKAGIGAAVAPGLGVRSADFNGDGWPDIYVANDGEANLLWLNNGNGTFRESALLAGAAYSADGIARAGMGLAVGDFDGSGNESIFVTNLTREGATLYRNTGDAQFNDSTMQFGLYLPTVPFTGFGTDWFDYDNDGRADLFIANGAVTMVEGLRGEKYPYHQRNLLLHNEGSKFRDASAEAGPPFTLSEVGRGAAFGDLDNNGTIDIVVANNNGPARVLLNETTRRGHWIELRLRGVRSNRDALGTRVTIRRAGQPDLVRRVHTDGSYLSASDPRVHVGLGDASLVTIVAEWPSGLKEQWQSLATDREYGLSEGSGKRIK